MSSELEIRFTTDEMEFRAAEGQQAAKLIGYAIRWNDLSGDLGGWQERVLPGAATASISSGEDIRALVSHDPDKLLGRTSNRTLSLIEDDKGVRVDIDVPDTSYARDLLALVKRGDVKKMSFGFTVPDGGARFKNENGIAVRELININLREVSAVANPAYLSTSLSVRVDPSIVRYLAQSKSKPNFDRCRQLLRSTLVRG